MIFRRSRLLPNVGVIGSFTEDMRHKLPAGIAINAGRIDEEIASDVFSNLEFNVGHAGIFVLTSIQAKSAKPINNLRRLIVAPKATASHSVVTRLAR